MAETIVRGISRRFGSVTALDDVSFTLPAGSSYGFVGPNGAGKTTAIRIMAGLDQPDSGEVLYDGISMTEYPERVRNRIGFMPDTLPDSASLRVWEYLDFFARAYGLTGEAKHSSVKRVSELTNLSSLAEKKLSELSKGLKQQVSLARILLHDPEVLLLDEPAAGLDPRARFELSGTLRRLNHEGKTIFLSSHILAELEDVVSGAIVLEKGILRFAGKLPAGAASARVQLTFSAETDEALLARLRSFKFISAVETFSPKQVMATLSEPGEKPFRTAMSELFLSGLPLSGVSRPDDGLEGLFMKSTKGEVQ